MLRFLKQATLKQNAIMPPHYLKGTQNPDLKSRTADKKPPDSRKFFEKFSKPFLVNILTKLSQLRPS